MYPAWEHLMFIISFTKAKQEAVYYLNFYQSSQKHKLLALLEV